MKKVVWRLSVTAFLIAGIWSGVCLFRPRAAAETSNLDEKIQEAEEAKKKAEKHVEELEKEIAELENSKDDIVDYVKKVDKKIEKVSETLSSLEKQVDAARTELKELETDVASAENVEKEQYETMRKRIRYMYENGGDDYMEVIFSANSLGDLLNRSEYIEKISKYDQKLFEQFVKTKEDVEQKRARMKAKVGEIAALREEALADKAALKELKAGKKAEMGKLDSAISYTDEKVQNFQDQVAKQEQEVENLLREKQEQIAKQEAAQKAAAGGAAQPSGAQPAGTTYANTGQLRWPLQEAGRISSRFGSRTSPTQGASTEHHGIDIAVSEGAPIVAAADGTVVTATYSASAGNHVMVYHGNSLYTVYMHASRLAVSEGTEVKQGDVIAYVGSTGISTGAHLHFGISINGEYVDPLNYVSQV